MKYARFQFDTLESRVLFSALAISVSVDGVAVSDGGSIDFGHTPVATPGSTKTVTLTNTSNSAVAVDVEVAADTGGQNLIVTPFTIVGGANFDTTISAGASASFQVVFNSAGSNDINAPQSLVSSTFTIAATSTDPNTAPAQSSFIATGTLLFPSPAITHKAYTFIDAGGEKVAFKLSGPGSAVISFAGHPNEPGAQADPGLIALTGVTRQTRITLVSRKPLTIGDLTADGPINSFAASHATLTGNWLIPGSVNLLSVSAIDSTWTGSISGKLTHLTVSGDASGSLAAAAIGSIHVGSLTVALYLAGASFGPAGEDTGGPGSIGSLTVTGSVSASTVAAGLHPVDGVFFDGDDVLTGTAKTSLFGPIVIRGALAADSKLLAMHFATVKIAGKRVNPTADPRFSLGSV